MKIESKENNAQVVSGIEMEAILSSLKIGIAKLDAQYNFCYANTVLSKIVGYSYDELLNKHFSLIVKSGKKTGDIFSELFPGNDQHTKMPHLLTMLTKSGSGVVCNIQVKQFVENDNRHSFIVLVEDATQKIDEEKMLKENLLRYNILNKAIQEGLWDWNMQTRQFYYNPNIKTLFGYDDNELQEGFEWWKQNIHNDDKEKVLNRLHMAMEEKNIESLHNEYRFKSKDGSYKIIADWFTIMRHEDGKPFRMIVSMQDYTEQHNLEKQLNEKEIVYRRQLARTVMDMQESERRKLAEELHDNVNQLLGVVKLYIEHSITNDNIREGLLKKSNEYIDKAIAALRNLSKNLSPPLLRELGLEHSVNSLADVISGVQDINITVDMIDFYEEGLTESHMLMLYRIIQEQLNNITKHSKAKNANITIRKTGTTIHLTIIDDGVGVDLTADNIEGMGLRNIRNRIELYQGNVEMTTSPGKGFILKVEFEI
ncbi:MAG: PAS domain S-box protein [Agriterribacter sp.]